MSSLDPQLLPLQPPVQQGVEGCENGDLAY